MKHTVYFSADISDKKQHEEAKKWAFDFIGMLEQQPGFYDIFSYYDSDGLAIEWYSVDEKSE